ncbi:MAG: tail fiber domain-containing protein, partial [Crocinitomicaceae bacterium]
DGADGLPGPSWTLTAPSFNTNGTMVVNGTAGSGGPVTSTAGAWLLDGNTNTAVKGFGTNSNTHVDFETNGITRGRFLNTGEMLWGNTGIIAPAMAGDPLHSYVVNNTNNWAFNAINTTAQGGSVFGSNTSMANAFSGIEGSTNGTGSGIKGMHMAISGGGIGIQGVTNSPAAAWAGIFMGDIGLTGAIWNISDARFKKNILPVSSVLAKVMELKVKKYNMRADEFPGLSLNPNKSEFGFIAQELKEVFPEIVQQKAIPDPLVLNSNKQNKEMVEGYYTVNYISLVPILTKAIQEQQNQILALNEQIGLQTQIDFSNLTQSRIIASDNARLNSENIFTANLDSKPYIIGVFEIDAIGNQKIQTNGVVTVDADNENGQILAGDHVTVSSLGKAVKSINQEWVLGVAVANEASGLVEVRIDIRFKH